MSDERYLTAIHEAGHATVAQALGFTVHEIGLNRGPGGGYCEIDAPRHDTLDAIQRSLAQVLAGRLAVALEQNESFDRLSGEIGSRLWNTIELEASSLDGERGTGMGHRDYCAAAGHLLGDELAGNGWMNKALPAAAEKAVEILRKRWVDVQALAIRLKATGEVDLGGEARREAGLREAIRRQEAILARTTNPMKRRAHGP